MQCFEGQAFGQNMYDAYTKLGYKGHPGMDWSCGVDSPIFSAFAGYAYRVLTPERPASDGFTAVNMIVDDGVELFEYQEGHCTPSITAGTYVKKGDLIGAESNHGLVYSGNILITIPMQKAGDRRGHHRHMQKRALKRTTVAAGALLFEDGGVAHQDADRNYYAIWAPNNGYNGCIDPILPPWTRDLWYGMNGYDVQCLQRFLKKQGYFTYPQATGYFGAATAAAVSDFQRAAGISPMLGYFGTKSRNEALRQYGWQPLIGPDGRG